MTDKEFSRRCRAARKRVAGMDATDGKRDRMLFTILLALGSGLRTPQSNDPAFDAYVMLEDRCDLATRRLETAQWRDLN